MKRETLVQGLIHNAAISGNRPLEQRLADTALWFSTNVDQIPRDNLASKQAFLEKACWCLIEMNAMLLERLREERQSKALFIPVGLNASGDMRRFG